ncbi:nuclease-related domain-containing protein [Macrococcus equipercicus]|uniref:NERD domain-containing protein n=1 Tax=Macrococcus equipercicus TaxID=69967 RepID=A0A9Q9F1H0_9STAP|nr:nuclease-related domain-containing protein [Macrococcus equipercicus]UTH13361.1 NERD domain-containing protein [Macrococcus equipercicus]
MKSLKPRVSLHQADCFRLLQERFHFSDDTAARCDKLLKGEYGETRVDELLSCFFDGFDGIYISDLRLNIDFQQVQVDSLIVLDDCVLVFEVKNLSFDLHAADGLFYMMSGEPFTALNDQLARLKKLLRAYVAQFDPYIDVIVYPFFINDSQCIHGMLLRGDVLATSNFALVLAKYRRRFNWRSTVPLVNHLMKRSVPNNFDKKMDIDYSKVTKGTYCSVCYNKVERISQRKFQCLKCNTDISTAAVISNGVKEISRIWPDKPITTKLVTDWLGESIDKRTIQRVLSKNYLLTKGNYEGWHYK